MPHCMVFALPQNTNGVSRFLAAVVRCKRCYPYAWPVRATWLSLWRLFALQTLYNPNLLPTLSGSLPVLAGRPFFSGASNGEIFRGRASWQQRQIKYFWDLVLVLHGCLVLEISTHDIFAFHMDISMLCACSLYLRVSTNF